MPKPVSRAQLKLMHAIMNGYKSSDGRGTPPKSVASKYIGHGSSKNLPDTSGENRGGSWSEHHHSKDKERVKGKREERKKHKKRSKEVHKDEVAKSLEQFYKGRGAGVIVTDKDGRILVGTQGDGLLTTPGGHANPKEDLQVAALRELREETGLSGESAEKISDSVLEGNSVGIFHVANYNGHIAGDGELSNIKFMHANEIPYDAMRSCAREAIRQFITTRVKKSIRYLLAEEQLQKNITNVNDRTLSISHGDALHLVRTGLFRFIKKQVNEMQSEDFKDIYLDSNILSIRKHVNDQYSGRVSDGHKVIHQFTNKSLPEITAELMSLFEWYSPEDNSVLEELDDAKLPDDAITGGLKNLIDNHNRHNLGNIYTEMENIRQDIRSGVTVDLQQIEARIMKLFDKLEKLTHSVVDKHNSLARAAGKEVEELESKLRSLQSKIEDKSNSPVVEGFTSESPKNQEKILDDYYCYLSKPVIEIHPSGKVKISFQKDWSSMDKENLLKDLKLKALAKNKKG